MPDFLQVTGGCLQSRPALQSAPHRALSALQSAGGEATKAQQQQHTDRQLKAIHSSQSRNWNSLFLSLTSAHTLACSVHFSLSLSHPQPFITLPNHSERLIALTRPEATSVLTPFSCPTWYVPISCLSQRLLRVESASRRGGRLSDQHSAPRLTRSLAALAADAASPHRIWNSTFPPSFTHLPVTDDNVQDTQSRTLH